MKSLISMFSAFCVAVALTGCADKAAAPPADSSTSGETSPDAGVDTNPAGGEAAATPAPAGGEAAAEASTAPANP